MSYDEKVLDYVESHREEIIQFMQKLLQTRSVTGDESGIGTLVAEESKPLSVSPANSELVKSIKSSAEKVVGFTPKPRAGF